MKKCRKKPALRRLLGLGADLPKTADNPLKNAAALRVDPRHPVLRRLLELGADLPKTADNPLKIAASR